MRKGYVLLIILVVVIASAIVGVYLSQTFEGQAPDVKVQIVATKNFGEDLLFTKEIEIPVRSSAMGALKLVAEVETGYGGGFVNAIYGIRSQYVGTPAVKQDWFFYVNGMLANAGALDYMLHEGDVEQWDFHDWSFQTYVTAIIGSFPEPFLHGYGGKTYPTLIVYGEGSGKDAVRLGNKLATLGVEDVTVLSVNELSENGKRSSNIIILGTADLPIISELNEIYDKIGFYAYFEDGKLNILDTNGNIVGTYLSGSVIQAAQNPWNPKGTSACENVVWMVAGLDENDVKNAVNILIERDDEFKYAFAIVIAGDKIYRVP